MKSRTHKLIVNVTFDKPCSKAHAAKEFADCIYGEFYPTQFKDDDPGTFRIRSVNPRRGNT